MKLSVKIPSAEVAAVLVGITVPCLVLGRAALALPIALAFFIVVWLPGRRDYFRAVLDAVRTPVGVLFLAVLVLWLPSMFASPLPVRSMEAWIRIPIFVCLVVFLAAMLSERRETLALSLKAFMVASALTTVFALSSLTFLPEALSFARRWGWSAMPFPGFKPQDILKSYATLSVLMAPVLVWAGWRSGKGWRGLAVATVIGLLGVVWLTYNRSAMVGLLAIAVVFAGLKMAVSRRPVGYVVIFVFLVVVILALLQWLNEARSVIQTPEGTVLYLPGGLIDYQRQLIWHRAVEFGMDAPWFGNGINVINLLPGADAPMPGNQLNIIPAHPHNWLVEVFAETGAVGAISLVILVATICLRLAGRFLRSHDGAILAALLVNVGYWSSGLLNVSFWSAWWQVSYLLMAALCLAGWKNDNTDSPDRQNRNTSP